MRNITLKVTTNIFHAGQLIANIQLLQCFLQVQGTFLTIKSTLILSPVINQSYTDAIIQILIRLLTVTIHTQHSNGYIDAKQDHKYHHRHHLGQ